MTLTASAPRRAGDPYLFQIGAIGSVLGIGALLAVTSLKIPVVCPLRLMTGVPCPLCGMTTGTTALLSGDVSGAAAANPLSFLFVPAMVALFFDRSRRFVRRLPEVSLGRRAKRVVVLFAMVALTASWVFELFRFQILG